MPPRARQAAFNPLLKTEEADAIVEAAIGRVPMTASGSEPPHATQQQAPSVPNAPNAMNVPGSFGRSSTTMFAGLGQDPNVTLGLKYMAGLDSGVPDRNTPRMTSRDLADFRAAQMQYEVQHMQASGQQGEPPDQDQQANGLSPLADGDDRM